MATIEDVARRAGVSRSTVSYALSGKRSISRETRERIEAAIKELGFTPNAGARALATSQTMVIGLFVQFLEDEFSPAMLQYVLPISDAAREAGYDILMVTEADGPHAVHRISSSGMVDGVVLLNVAHEDPRLPVMRKMRQPGSMVGLPRTPEGFDVFDLDFAESARILVDHLAERGHRELILITPREHVYERGGAYAWRFRDAALAAGGNATASASAPTSASRSSLPSTSSSTRSSTRSRGTAIDRAQRCRHRRAAVGAVLARPARARRPVGRQHLLGRLRASCSRCRTRRSRRHRTSLAAWRSRPWCDA